MSNKARDSRRKWNAILEELADYIETAPANDLLEDARAAGKDPAQTAAEVKRILLDAVTGFEQRKLRAAREAHQQRVRSMSTRSYSLPESAAERRAMLYGLFARNPEMGAVLTTQHRNFEEMTDQEVESALQELAELGFLEEGGPKQGE
jgi:hypothetical protein